MRSLFVPAAVILSAVGHAQNVSLLDTMRDQSRPVLLFAGSNSAQIAKEHGELARHRAELQDRQMRIILIGNAPDVAASSPLLGTVSATEAEATNLRTRFHVAPQVFTLILLGKDGGEKFRSTRFVPYRTLADLIDAMPMRRQEMHSR